MKKKLIISLIAVILVLGVAFAIGALVKENKDILQDMIIRIESAINAVLRGLESDFDAGNHERASLIHSALSQSSIPQSCTVYRGASLSSLGNYANATDEELIGNITN